jgi:uncharacterized protein YeaO (DUF488 family)
MFLPADRYDVWMPNLAPSEKLLNQGLTWGEFAKCYRKELKEDGSIDRKSPYIKNHGQKFTLRLLQKLGQSQNVTLMCHCAEDQQHCHRHLLKRIQGRLNEAPPLRF